MSVTPSTVSPAHRLRWHLLRRDEIVADDLVDGRYTHISSSILHLPSSKRRRPKQVCLFLAICCCRACLGFIPSGEPEGQSVMFDAIFQLGEHFPLSRMDSAVLAGLLAPSTALVRPATSPQATSSHEASIAPCKTDPFLASGHLDLTTDDDTVPFSQNSPKSAARVSRLHKPSDSSLTSRPGR